MPRTPRRDIIEASGSFHVIARGNNKCAVFLDHDDYEIYLALMREAKTRHRVFLHHYILMPNHLHFLLQQPECSNISGFMHFLQTEYVKFFCKKYKYVGHVWQARFKSLPITTEAYMYICGNYIELNPVRAGLVPNPKDWLYSSYRTYAFGEKNDLVDFDPFYLTRSKEPKERQKFYREAFEQENRGQAPLGLSPIKEG